MSCLVTDRDLSSMIDDLNRAIPGLALSADQVQRVMSGILPVRKPGSTVLSKRPVMARQRIWRQAGSLAAGCGKYDARHNEALL
jgi:hypothetical protein